MAGLPVLTRELALRLEARGAPVPNGWDASGDPHVPVVTRCGRTIASKARGGRPSNMVFCFGHDDVARLDEILEFYAADGLEPSFCLAPMGFTRQVAEALVAAGFAQRDFEQAVLYGLPSTEPGQLPPGMTIERVTAATADEYVRVLADGFEWPSDWRDEAMNGVRSGLRMDEYHFLARFEGEPAGVGSLPVREGIGHLTAGAVVPTLRGKGCHRALVEHRQWVAWEIGCDLILGGASFGSGSFRNQLRAGLGLAYVESIWTRT